MNYPNRIQAALLLDTRFEALDELVRDFARIAQMKSGAIFTITEHHPGSFVRLAGGSAELLLTFEVVPTPPLAHTLADALASPVTGMLCADMPERVARANGHLLLEASHGVLGGLEDDPRFAALLGQLAPGAPELQSAAQPAAFETRLDTLALMARVASDQANPVAVHWTQSDRLLDPETFEAMAICGFPGPLAIHPLLFGSEPTRGEPAQIGLRTLGARLWLGREVVVPATALPWPVAYQAALDFTALASAPGGYVIPDGDTFGPEDGSELWRVHHREAGCNAASDPAAPDPALSHAGDARADTPGDTPALYELEPLRHDPSGFRAHEQPPAAAAPDSLASAPSADQACAPAPAPDPARDPGDGTPESAAAGALEEARTERSRLAEMQAALAEGRALAAAAAPEKPPFSLIITTHSRPGSVNVSGRSLRARVFGGGEEACETAPDQTSASRTTDPAFPQPPLEG